MFERIQNIFSGIGYAIEYGGTIRSVTKAWSNFPGLNGDGDALRLWLRPLLTDAATLALLTKTSIDDIIVQAAVRILDNNNAWAVVHGMALLVQEGFPFDGSLVPESGDVFEMSRRVASDTMPECPAAVISAIGVILFLLQNRNKKG